ncbi:MAG: hypothetical protein PVG42_07815 [Lysobacterales bacterium]|jgi:tetratricopeptide (TPR) repeat protein
MNKPAGASPLPGWVAALAITAVALLAFANAWPNALVFDDKYFAGARLFEYLSSHFVYFSTDVWSLAGMRSELYRPLLLMSLMLDWRLWGDWHAGFHLTNLALNALASLMVFGFVRELIRRYTEDGRTSDVYALFAALLFAAHPVHAEVVNSIFNRSDLLVTIGGAGGLWWLLHHLDRYPARAWTGFALAYLFALFCKESATVIPGLAVVIIVLYEPGSLMDRIKKFLPVFWLLLPMALYFVLRNHALSTPVPSAEGGEELVSGLSRELLHAKLTSGRNLVLTLSYLGEGLKLLIWPYPLRISYPRPETPAIIGSIIAQTALLMTGAYRFWKGKPGLLASLAFFYVAILPASRLINIDGTEPHLAERYLYFPSVGLAILLAFALRFLGRRRSRRTALFATGLALVLIIPISWVRNGQWTSDVSLFESDYLLGQPKPYLLRLLSATQVKMHNFRRVEEICDSYPDFMSDDLQYAMQCGVGYAALGRKDEAAEAFKMAAADPAVAADAHASLARWYLENGNREEADRQFQQAIDAEHYPYVRAFRTADRLISLYPTDPEKLEEARNQLREALRMAPNFEMARQWLDKLDKLLGPGPTATTPSAEPSPGDGG